MNYNNIENYDCQKIYKNNKLISTINLNDDDLFALNTQNIKNYNLVNNTIITKIDYDYWYGRLSHFSNNKNIKDLF